MKLFPTLALAALLSAGAAYAATTPTATPASSATPAAASSSSKHHSATHCEKEAKAKKLTGDEEKKFVKECKEGKSS
jgi:hypothetical protein